MGREVRTNPRPHDSTRTIHCLVTTVGPQEEINSSVLNIFMSYMFHGKFYEIYLYLKFFVVFLMLSHVLINGLCKMSVNDILEPLFNPTSLYRLKFED